MLSLLLMSPISAQKFGKKGGVAANDSTYNGQGEVTNGTYSINGDTGAAKLGPITSTGPIVTVSTITASNVIGTNTGDQTDIIGNSATATRLQTPRTINGVPFDGTSPITINAVDSVGRLGVASNLSDVANVTAARTNLGAAASGANTDITSITGSAARLTTARTLSLTGDVTGSTTFDGTANASTTTTLSTINSNVGTFGSGVAIPIITVDAKGRITSVSTSSVTTAGTGTVTNVSVATANGVSGSVATSTTTPAITLSLDAITPSSVNASGNVSGSTLTSTVSTGTAPLTVVSTTVVPNLNASLLNGQAGSYYNNAANLTGTVPVASLPAITGDVNMSSGTNVASLSTVNSNVGTFGSASTVPVVTVDVKGRITSVATATITGTVSNVSVTTANGVSGTVATSTSTPAITLSLGAITPTSVAATGTVTGSNLSGTNTGDQTTITGNAGTATALATGRTLGITGDLVYTSPTFNGTANVTAAGTLATVNSNVGTFGSTTAVPIVTVNGKGLVTGVSTATLGSAAVKNTGTSGNVVALLDATNTWSAANIFTGNLNSDYQLRVDNSATTDFAQAILSLSTGIPNSFILHNLHNNTGSPYYQIASGPAVIAGYFDFDTHVFRNKAKTTKATWSANGDFTMSGIATFDGADAEEQRVSVKGGKLSVNSFDGASASATEAMDWPVPPFSVRTFGDFTSQTVAMFGLANDPEYVADESIWNIKLYQTANSLTSSGVNGLSLMGPGQLILGSGGTSRIRLTSVGDVLIGTSSRSNASVGTATFFGSEVMSRGAQAGYFWEDRAGGVTSTSNWGGWYQSSGVTFLYNGGANVASINMSSGAYAALSDARKKDRFVDSDLGLESVKLVTPTFYNLKNTDPVGAPRKLGFRAQDIEAAGIDAAVVRINTTDALGIDNEWLGLDPMPLIAVLWKATRDLSNKVDALEERIARLEALMTP